MKKTKISLMTILSLLLFFLVWLAGCGGGGSSGDVNVNPTDSPSPSPTSTTGNLTVNGVVRDENGFPIQGATVTLESQSANGQQTARNKSSSDSMGEFTISQVTSGTYNLQVSKDGRYNISIQNYVINNTSIPSMSVTQPEGSGTLEINTPDDITVTATASGNNVNLSWSQSSASGFEGYVVNRSNSEGITILDDNIGKFTAIGSTSMTDTNLNDGTYYYKVFQIVTVQGYQMIFASNEASVTVNSNPYNYTAGLYFSMSKADGYGAWYAVCPTAATGNMDGDMNITVTAPVLSSTESLAYVSDSWKKIKKFYYGNPVTYCGEVTDYMTPAMSGGYQYIKTFTDGADISGKHYITVEGQDIEIADLTGSSMPNKDTYYIMGTLSKNGDGSLKYEWYLVFGGAIVTDTQILGRYKYLVQVYTLDGGSTYRCQKMWSNADVRNVTARNFPGMLNFFSNLPTPTTGVDGKMSVTIPRGLFSTGEEVNANVIGFDTSGYNYSDSEVSGYGKLIFDMWRHGYDTTIP